MKQAMLLAAGRGRRLAPLTDSTPKPLLQVGGEAVLLRHLRHLAAAGYSRVAINLHHLGEQIRQAVGDGSAFGLEVRYSPEAQLLGTAGGIRQALACGHLREAPFALVNGDVVCDYDLSHLAPPPAGGCHLLLVDTPPAKARGDFFLRDGALAAANDAADALTYAGIGSYHPALFAGIAAGCAHDMLPLLLQAIQRGCASGAHHRGDWHDIGTPAALAAARRQLGG